MNRFIILLISAIVSLGLPLITTANAQINLFTQHQTVYMLRHGVNKSDDVRFKTGDFPYLGQLGVEYIRNNFTYSLSYIHRSNIDLVDVDEYNYDGISLGIKYAKCLISC